jgi:IS5 family transposase
VALQELVNEADAGKTLHADSAYRGVEIEQILKDLNIENRFLSENALEFLNSIPSYCVLTLSN